SASYCDDRSLHSFPTRRSSDLALIDFQMPDLDGLGLAAQIQARPELSTTMIMMLSSVGHRGDAARLRDLGVASYLTKPVRQSMRSEEHTSELQSHLNLVCRLLL